MSGFFGAPVLLYVMSAPHSAQILTDMGESEAIVLLMGAEC